MEVILTMKEQDRIKVLNELNSGKIKNQIAARKLGLSVRQVQRLNAAYKKAGVVGIVNKRRGRKTGRGYSEELKKEIIKLYKDEYPGWNFSHFRDTLEDEYSIIVSRPFVQKLLTANGCKSCKARKHKLKAHPPRPRRENAGELIQIDASDHNWIILADGTRHHLHGGIDDCTGIVVAAYLEEEETIHGYQMVLRDIIKNYGIPETLYTDYRTVFQSNKRLSPEEVVDGKEDKDIKATRFSEMCSKLGIGIISTMEPTAKGRIERLWQTFQDRLTKELLKKHITSIEEANRYIKDVFLPRYNKRFASKIDCNRNCFVKVPKNFNYNKELALKTYRRVYHGNYIQINRHFYALKQHGIFRHITSNAPVEVYLFLDQTLHVFYKEEWYELEEIHRVKREEIASTTTQLQTGQTKINTQTKTGLDTQMKVKLAEEFSKQRPKTARKNNSPWRKSNSLFFKQR